MIFLSRCLPTYIIVHVQISIFFPVRTVLELLKKNGKFKQFWMNTDDDHVLWLKPTQLLNTPSGETVVSVCTVMSPVLDFLFCSSLLSFISVLNVNTFFFFCWDNQSSTSLSIWTLSFGLLALTCIVRVSQNTLRNMYDQTWYVTSLMIRDNMFPLVFFSWCLMMKLQCLFVFFLWKANTHQVLPWVIHYHIVSLQAVHGWLSSHVVITISSVRS